jgi:thiamine-phosphate pyrophosphorylase
VSLLSGLYAITDAQFLPDTRLIEGVAAAIDGGARIIQYRDKSSDRPRRLKQAKQLLQLCRSHGIPLIINDDIGLAADIGADGVHLGKEDADIDQARRALPDGIVGLSCYNEWPRAECAVRAGADYIAFGAFFPSVTKPDTVRAETALLQRAVEELDIPMVAIGGITAENGAALIGAGADMLAAVEGIFGQSDIRRAAQGYARLFNQP